MTIIDLSTVPQGCQWQGCTKPCTWYVLGYFVCDRHRQLIIETYLLSGGSHVE